MQKEQISEKESVIVFFLYKKEEIERVKEIYAIVPLNIKALHWIVP